jgi:hypothetical protein
MSTKKMSIDDTESEAVTLRRQSDILRFQESVFRYVTKDPVLSVTVKIFNMRGRPIDAVRQIGSNEVKWLNPDVYAGLYIYLLEAELEGGKRKQVKNVMEVLE